MKEDDAMATIAASLMITDSEGWLDSLYPDPAGHPTIGYGFRLDIKGALPKHVGEIWLAAHLAHIITTLDKEILVWPHLPIGAKAVLIDMAYNMGIDDLMKFKDMLQALREGKYAIAADEIMDSKYAKQVPTRAERNARIFRLIANARNKREPCPDAEPQNLKAT